MVVGVTLGLNSYIVQENMADAIVCPSSVCFALYFFCSDSNSLSTCGKIVLTF